MTYVDKELVCVECGANFIFTTGEQEFYASRGLTNEPRRCSNCRQSRKDRRYRGDDRPREMYPAVCANCGVETQVPFKPTGVRPVYCTECFNSARQ
ncbi:zinc-ribbon domain containing protein [Dehalococcoidia bacterium]|nr:zinc-ribbon domain containing protein [Dehalococcoidia bacterium]